MDCLTHHRCQKQQNGSTVSLILLTFLLVIYALAYPSCRDHLVSLLVSLLLVSLLLVLSRILLVAITVIIWGLILSFYTLFEDCYCLFIHYLRTALHRHYLRNYRFIHCLRTTNVFSYLSTIIWGLMSLFEDYLRIIIITYHYLRNYRFIHCLRTTNVWWWSWWLSTIVWGLLSFHTLFED